MKVRASMRLALGAVSLCATLTSFGQTPSTISDEKLKALEARQSEIQKTLEALKAPGSSAEDKARLAALEQQVKQLQKDIEALKTGSAAQPSPGPVEAKGLVTKSFPLFGTSGQVTSGTSFNPSISIIPDIVYYRDSEKGGALEMIEEADGFHGAHAEGGHEHGGLSEGFNLRETEIAFSASVDPYFDVWALFAASEEGFSAEEVYFQTRRLPAGLTLKAGKFLSGIGYANKQHPHQWDFVDQNLPYQLLLGDHGLNEKGIQISWLPKLPFYLQLGAELLQGENEKIANYMGGDEFPSEDPDAEPVTLSKQAGPRLFTGFVKIAPEIGYDHALQFGLSYASSQKHQEVHDEDGDGIAGEVLDGKAQLFGADLVYKYDSPREYGAGDLVLVTEYLFRKKDLDILGTNSSAVSKQDGFYFQAVYGIAPRLQLAARCEAAGLTNEQNENGVNSNFGTSKRWSAALTFNPTEFSRIRAQYNRGEIWRGGEKDKLDQFMLQVQLSVGAHGAHRF